MAKRLIVAEKPSVARDIARVLKCGRAEGFFESDTDRVTWALGHLVTLVEPDELEDRYKRWRQEDLPINPQIIPLKVLPKTRSQFALIKKLMNAADTGEVVCATDAGREGELIFRLIYEMAGCKKPVSRLWISSLTDAAIKEGFAALRPGKEYQGLYDSALCRAQADWLVGMNASRAFTLRYKALLSVGRVQTPTLKILVDRLIEMRDFVPEEFYTLTADFGDYEGNWVDPQAQEEKTAHRIKTEQQAKDIQAAVKGQTGRVESAQTTQKREAAPQLYDLTTLQRDANRLLGFTASKTLKTAQALYEGRKALTYPRTDSRYLPNDMIPRVNKALSALPAPYQGLTGFIPRKEGKLPYSKRVFDNSRVSDHHAIIPTPQTPDLSKFTADEKALFDLVARRFVAAFCPPFVYDQTTVITKVKGHAFKSTGRVVKDLGWKAVITAKDPQEPAVLPDLTEGEERQVKSIKRKKDSTKPPVPHTDASLLYRMEHTKAQTDDEALMEALKESGLGTPATRASIIERLIAVGYAQRRGKAILATDKGEKLIAVVPEEIASPIMTGKWEQALEEIAKSERQPERFMQGIRRLTAFLVDYARDQAVEMDFPREVRGKGGRVKQVAAAKELEGLACPLCGKAVQESDRAFGCSDWKNGCRFTLWKNAFYRVKGPALNEAIVRLLIKDGNVQGKSGTLFIKEGQLCFTKTGQQEPTLCAPLAYEKKPRTASTKTTASKAKKAPARKPKI